MIYSDVDAETLLRNPILCPPPDSYSPLSQLLSRALVSAQAIRQRPGIPETLEGLLEASKGVRGVNRGDVIGRQVAERLGQVPGLLLDASLTRAITRRTLEGLPS